MTGFGPLTCGVTGPLGSPANSCRLFDTGQLGMALTDVNVTINVGVVGYAGSAWDMAVAWFDVTDTLLRGDNTGTLHFNATTTANITTAAPAGATRLVIAWAAALNSPDTASGTINGSYGTTAYCQYGTEVKAGIPDVVYLVPSLLTAIVGAITDGWAWPLASVFGGHALDVTVLCANPQPNALPLTGADMVALVDLGDPVAAAAAWNKAWTWIRAAAWQYFCQCSGGVGPAPISPPPPGPTTLTGFQPNPVVLCDGGDPCAALAAIQATVNAIFQQLNLASQLVTLIQRQAVPFAYVQGTRHADLSGNGQFAVSDILALSVQSTTVPPSRYTSTGDPYTYWGLGWVAIGTADGWTKSYRVSHNPELILPDEAGAFTLVGYSLGDGVVADIVELIREP